MQTLTFPLERIPLGSAMMIQPRRQPGASHLLEMPPTVNTGTFIEKAAMGVNPVVPNTILAYISSDMSGTFNFSAVFAICKPDTPAVSHTRAKNLGPS